MLEMGVLVPLNFLYICPMWSIQNANGSWRQEVDYQDLSEIVFTVASAVPGMVSKV